jgi:predicted  nucleic acid-binding Zn-ribbon protein
MNTGQLIISLISIIVMFIPIGGLLWRLSKVVFQVETNKKDLDSLAHKLNNRVDKIDERFIENEAKLSNIEITMGRLEEKLNILLIKITDRNQSSYYGGGG